MPPSKIKTTKLFAAALGAASHSEILNHPGMVAGYLHLGGVFALHCSLV